MHTAHKTFNQQAKQAGEVMTGNVWGKCQLSNYIRSASTLECNGITNKPGHLQNFDLGLFGPLPNRVRNAAQEVANDAGQCILYKIRHWRGKTEIVDGWIITEGHKTGYKLRHALYESGTNWKQRDIIDTVARKLSEN